MKKYIDYFSFSVFLVLLGFAITSLGILKNHTKLMFSGIGIIVLAGIILAYLKKKGTAKIVENKYDKSLYIKPEEGEIDRLKAHETDKTIDGIQIPNNRSQIRKFRNGVNIKIDSNGQARAVNFISHYIVQEDLEKSDLPDNWNKLFEEIKK